MDSFPIASRQVFFYCVSFNVTKVSENRAQYEMSMEVSDNVSICWFFQIQQLNGVRALRDWRRMENYLQGNVQNFNVHHSIAP